LRKENLYERKLGGQHARRKRYKGGRHCSTKRERSLSRVRVERRIKNKKRRMDKIRVC